MKINEVRELTAIGDSEMNQLVATCKSPVTATDQFLSSKEIATIKQYVPQAICIVQRLIVVLEDKPRFDMVSLEDKDKV